ncbi:MAG: 6-hydroxymethylpterin diphosphokinase MptE-like protein [Planctomycetota bacterium]
MDLPQQRRTLDAQAHTHAQTQKLMGTSPGLLQLPPNASVFERNCAALELRNPSLARTLRNTPLDASIQITPVPPRSTATATDTDPAVELLRNGSAIPLTSRRDPAREASRLISDVSPVNHACACVLGFGAGYHCRALAQQWGRDGVILCFEPDISLLRGVMEHIDHSAWIAGTNLSILHSATDSTAIHRAIKTLEPLAVHGAKIVAHPPSKQRLGDDAERFCRAFTNTIKTVRTAIATTLVQSRATLRNELMIMGRYATESGIADLEGSAAGRPAVVVSAGPSLARNLHHLAAPGVRDRVVIIAATTVLKPMLEAGVKPHYVCALDYTDISKRFVEGIDPADVEDTELILEPQASPAIASAFPGRVRFIQNARLDAAIGEDLHRSMGKVPTGATVAHLCYFLARYMGCDPVILVGQDLGFTDGQYYAAGAAIHSVWAPELSEFRTLEMFEWERIARQGAQLRAATDVFGRAIFTDEQMAAYLQQFEVAFTADAAEGLLTIDATEGGVAKAAADPMNLVDALDWYAADAEPLDLPRATTATDAQSRLQTVQARLERVARDTDTFRPRCADTVAILEDAKRCAATSADHNNSAAAKAMTAFDDRISRVHAIRDEVMQLEPLYTLAQFINQTGVYRRTMADRALRIQTERSTPALTEHEAQLIRIDRDIDNVRWLSDASEEIRRLAQHASRVLSSEAAPLTRDDHVHLGEDAGQQQRASEHEESNHRVEVFITLEPDISGLGTPRDISRPIWQGKNAFELTLARVLAPTDDDTNNDIQTDHHIDGVTIITGDPARARALAGEHAANPRLRFIQANSDRIRARARRVGVGRLWSHAAWRGGIAGLSCYDECLDPELLADAMGTTGADAAIIVGADWSLVDPALLAASAQAFRRRPDTIKIAFTQAPPGLAGFLLTRATANAIAAQAANAPRSASIGAALSYIPAAPQNDPIARDYCTQLDPAVRDAGARFIPDTIPGRERVTRILDTLAANAGAAPTPNALDITRADRASQAPQAEPPREIVLETNTDRLGTGLWTQGIKHAMNPSGEAREPLTPDRAAHIVARAAAEREDVVVTLHGAGDPLLHPRLPELITAIKHAGAAAVHLRTDMLRDDAGPEHLLATHADVISVDALAATPETHAKLTGTDRYDAIVSTLEQLFTADNNAAPGQADTPWIVPRITRCDETYEDIARFYDGWLVVAGTAVIDPALPPTPPPAPSHTDIHPPADHARIAALPIPAHAAKRLDAERLTVRSNGVIPSLENLGPNVWDLPLSQIHTRAHPPHPVTPEPAIIDRPGTELAEETPASA